MINENDTAEAEEVAKKISKETDCQIMSNSVMALRQCVEDRLEKNGNANSILNANSVSNANLIFKKKVKDLYEEDMEPNSSPKVYVHIDYYEPTSNDISARVFSRIDKVENTVDKKISYALHLRIMSRGENRYFPSYDGSFISRNCGRFAVGHDICHTVINLDDLINAATKKESRIEVLNKLKECKADFFSYIQSDLRDFDLIKSELNGKISLDLNKAFSDYKLRKDEEIDKKLSEKEKNEKDKILTEIRKVFDESEELYKYSKRYTMSYSIFALKKIINELHSLEYEKLNEKHKNFVEELGRLIEKDKKFIEKENEERKLQVPYGSGKKQVENNKKWNIIRIKMQETQKQIDNIKKEVNKLYEENPKVNVHLVSCETNGKEPTVYCSNRIDENGKNFYCLEINIRDFSKEEKEYTDKEVCKAIGCLYFGYKERTIKKIIENKCLGIPEMLQKLGLKENKIDCFAKKLHELRDSFIKDKLERLKKEKHNEYLDLKARLTSYSI
ncbi:hypothetical protein R83H12_01436 [Fibrobacteria bacterium R8-3-H12]